MDFFYQVDYVRGKARSASCALAAEQLRGQKGKGCPLFEASF